jgi:mannose/cellobiose epimerase-like protein (N-acyl-D-glucosamine 2-epimerase family)
LQIKRHQYNEKEICAENYKSNGDMFIAAAYLVAMENYLYDEELKRALSIAQKGKSKFL